MAAKPGDVLYVEGTKVMYKKATGGSPSILQSMNNWQGGNPVRAEWNGTDVLIHTEKGWIYKIKNAIGSPSIFQKGK